MPDRDGLTIGPGDPVIIADPRDPDNGIAGIILRETGSNHYLVQMDPRSPREVPSGLPAWATADADQVEALLDEARLAGVDSQEAFEVDGSELTYLGELEGDDDDPISCEECGGDSFVPGAFTGSEEEARNWMQGEGWTQDHQGRDICPACSLRH
jgi:hypothetical protein